MMMFVTTGGIIKIAMDADEIRTPRASKPTTDPNPNQVPKKKAQKNWGGKDNRRGCGTGYRPIKNIKKSAKEMFGRGAFKAEVSIPIVHQLTHLLYIAHPWE